MKIIDVNQYHPSVAQVQHIIRALVDGKIVILPTDTYYCACCIPSNKDAVKLLIKLQDAIDKIRPLTFLCKDISQASELMHVDTMNYRILNAVVPASITFILPAHQTTLKKLKMKSRSVVGVRIPHHQLLNQILEACDSPLIIQSIEHLEDDMDVIRNISPFVEYWLKLQHGCINKPSTIIDMLQNQPKLIRSGQDIKKIAPFIELYN